MSVARWLAAALLLGACTPQRTPPPRLMFAGLPITGSFADAKHAGFTDCFSFDSTSMRCRRHKVMLLGTGPYEAAVDLVGGDGGGGFDQVTLWHDTDQYAVYAVTDVLEKQHWRSCNTGTGDHGDQNIYTRANAKVRISMDLSYWAKRRLRVLPTWSRERRC